MIIEKKIIYFFVFVLFLVKVGKLKVQKKSLFTFFFKFKI